MNTSTEREQKELLQEIAEAKVIYEVGEEVKVRPSTILKELAEEDHDLIADFRL